MWPFLFKTVTIVLWMIFEILSSVHPKNIHHFSMKQASTYDPGTIRKKHKSFQGAVRIRHGIAAVSGVLMFVWLEPKHIRKTTRFL